MGLIEARLDALDDLVKEGVGHGLAHCAAQDDELDGRVITVDGKRLVSFGSCSYLGLETHPELVAAVVDAVTRYGSQFSSSRTYLSAPGYAPAEAALTEMFGRPALISPSTTMGHLAALPVVVGSEDVVLLDAQVHFSVQVAARLVQAQGIPVELLPHSDLRRLERRVTELAGTHRRVWYMTDGIYSMYADPAPIAELSDLADRHPNLWLYIDDAHAISWTGRFGRGYALDRLSAAATERAIVTGSLNKSFAAAGGVLTFPDAELRRRVFALGGPLIFSGPVQPPMLGAILASARLHLTDAVAPRRAYLNHLIDLFNRLAAERDLPVVSPSATPIRCVGVGRPPLTYRVGELLRDAGFFVDIATSPAVPAKRSGIRISLTAHHTDQDVVTLVESLTAAIPQALAEGGSSMSELRRAFGRQLTGRAVPSPREPAA
ncbi:aminotransferase class I/II-fold pyridoxal phosphate-dependent enzyme [Spirilliplanes yamanashiensis]|uniref:8-amino-7-oxononanoate synthase n=1 Tax=Spirilliplanes yamanashiensis TaxID=42233 RepID=A0A8J4DM84_9ACTN|nr:aminotransferase class I/II-fold pyridoxal phosphate-dependent enzyme [Spirilliplanes yamanashiensis]MDP9816368.1 7-keto-8-aminopelargonate synthetase-like enzyme [Spirilliplanes yamanashiensis]GIJ05895.1 7-keto-8-aminopelargonate synthetase [Spirilliplanes yamanashiensis]